VQAHDGTVTISLPNAEEHMCRIVGLLYEQRVPVESVSVRKPTLEDVFLHFTGKTIREEEGDHKDTIRMFQRRMRRR
jgi:ABC-2 type transport system ATP-binding protein